MALNFQRGTPGMDIRVGDYVKYPSESSAGSQAVEHKIIRVERDYHYRGFTGDWIFTDKKDSLLSECLLSDSNIKYLMWARPKKTLIIML